MIDWTQVVTDTISGLIVEVILAGLGYIFINKYTQSIAFAKRFRRSEQVEGASKAQDHLGKRGAPSRRKQNPELVVN